jgi:hypothetical protein
MPDGAEFFEEFGQVPWQQLPPLLWRQRGFRRGSLRREYLGKEQAA